ncbi:hypothetical protein ACIPT2_05990 [Pectobacterium brasiliense]|uniref:hypothetical protein n=1 Tax=Pectobacterium brasiliense TaxID=180957 RepID=UPI0038047AAF
MSNDKYNALYSIVPSVVLIEIGIAHLCFLGKALSYPRKDTTAAFPHLSFDFNFHDLKAKGVSDLEESLAEK